MIRARKSAKVKRIERAASAAKPNSRKKKLGSLTDRIYERLRREILTCRLDPGKDISEATLAEQFGVSKTPVREALATLRSDGLVRAYPRRGYQVVPITIADMNDLFRIRTILEAGAAELACEHISNGELDELQKLANVAYDRTQQLTLERFIRANRDFHTAIARGSGNERLAALVGKHVDELERFFYLGAQLRDVNMEVINEHLEIVEVLRRRDSTAARKIMILHNEKTRQGLLNSLVQKSSASHIAF
jgi:DNA-binding GntR family transcriptional regulator